MIVGSTFVGNDAEQRGGALSALGTFGPDGPVEAVTTILNSTFRDNTGGFSGGAIASEFNATTSLINSALIANSAGSGGAIISGGAFTIINSTISDNTAEFNAGAILHNSGTLMIAHSTLTGNRFGFGAAVSSFGAEITATASIFDNGPGANIEAIPRFPLPGDPDPNPVGGFRSGGNNLFSDRLSFGLDPSDLVDTDPRLGPVRDNGGPTVTRALLPGSPAIDAAAPVLGVVTDQRGITRPQGPAPDIGAFEFVPGPAIEIEPTAAAALLNTEETVTATVRDLFPDRSVPLSGVAVAFRITSGPNAGTSGTLDPIGGQTDSAGVVRFTYTGVGGVGTDTIVALATLPDETVITSMPATRTWVIPEIAVTPAPASRLLDRPITLNARLALPDGTPVPGIPVTFEVVSGPNAGTEGVLEPGDGRTDADGRARFTYTGDGGTGVDVVRVSADVPGLPIEAFETTVRWVERLTPADFDGDGVSDLVTYASFPSPNFEVGLSTGGTIQRVFESFNAIPLVGDYDGDGIADLATYSFNFGAGFATFSILRSSDGATMRVDFGGANDLPIAGDYDGDGITDIAVHGLSPDDGFTRFAIRPSSDPDRAFPVPFGSPVDVAVPGDYDGDGVTDLAVYGLNPGPRFAIRPSSDVMAGYTVDFGGFEDSALPGDYDGDGRTDIAVYGFSRSLGVNRIELQPSGGGSLRTMPFGNEGNRAAVVDYDGDGVSDPAVFGAGIDPQGAGFLILGSASGTLRTVPFGTDPFNARPLPASVPLLQSRVRNEYGFFAPTIVAQEAPGSSSSVSGGTADQGPKEARRRTSRFDLALGELGLDGVDLLDL